MTHHHISHLPVFEELELVGIVSIEDLVNSVTADQSEIDELHRTWG
jgi:CBS domain-containing protein